MYDLRKEIIKQSLSTIIKENNKRHETIYFYILSYLFYSLYYSLKKNHYYLLTSNSVNDRILANRNSL